MSNYALAESFSNSRRSLSAMSVRRLNIRGALPVVRQAILATHSPRLTERRTKRAGDLLKARWPRWQHQYVAKMAEIAGLEASDFGFAPHEVVRYRHEGKTPMIDLPRIRTRDDVPHQCDQRNCVALCTDRYSSKFWTRIGTPANRDGCASAEEVRELTERYRRQVSAAGEWFYDEFHSLTAGAFRGVRIHRDADILEVSTVGLRVDDEFTEDEFDAWLFDGDRPNLGNDELCEYLAAAANMNVEDLGKNTRGTYWLAMPSTILSAKGVLVSRRVLYLSRKRGNVTQLVGIGLDDSALGDLANEVALKLSSLIASGI